MKLSKHKFRYRQTLSVTQCKTIPVRRW